MNAEQLYAYLDGRLASEERVALERALDVDPELRERLAALERADAALELLPGAEVGEDFASRVLSTARVDGALDLLPGHDGPPAFAEQVVHAARRERRRGLVLRIGVCAAAAAAIALGVVFLPPAPERAQAPAEPVAEYRWEVDTDTFESLDLEDLEDEILEELDAT